MVFFKRKFKVLFVCTENICRSPLAEGLLRHHLRAAGLQGQVKSSSAGTVAGRPGAKPDPRAIKVAASSGISLKRIRASRISTSKLAQSDLILALDHSHYEDLMKVCPPEHQHKVELLLTFLPENSLDDDVPDPYYGSADGFLSVFDIIDEAVIALTAHLGERFQGT